MDINVEILVQLDDALEGTALLLHCRIGNVETFGNLEVVFARKSILESLELLDDFGLLDYRILEVLHLEVFVFLEKLHRAVEQIGLVGFRHLKLLRHFLGDKVLVHRHHIVGVVVLVLTLLYVQEVVGPVVRLGAVGIVDDLDHKAVFALVVEHYAALVHLSRVDATVTLDAEVFAVALDLEECVLVFGLEQPHGINNLAIDLAVAEEHHIKFARLDVGMRTFFVQMLGKVYRLLEKLRTVIKNLGYIVANLVVR